MNLTITTDTVHEINFNNQRVDYLYYGNDLVWPKNVIPTSTEYFTIESVEDNNVISFTIRDQIQTTELQSISYSRDLTNWTTLQNVDNQYVSTGDITLNTGDKLYWKGIASNYGHGNISGNVWTFSWFTTSKLVNVSGNIMSLLYGDNFANQTTLPADYTFLHLFYSSKILNSNNLVLPATTCTFCCYKYLFSGQTQMITHPTLPATVLASQCYENMFSGTAITTLPALPAATLEYGCYYEMFAGCSGLTNLSNYTLIATTLARRCYTGMFNNCTNLVSAPVLPATNLAQECYQGMFQGCTSLTQAPELLASVLANASYYHMFDGCSLLNMIVCLATSFTTYSTDGFLLNTASSGTFYKDSNATWSTGDNGIPSGWTVQNYN